MEFKESIIEPCIGPSLMVGCMIDRCEKLPEQKYIFRGIVHPSLGVIFGPAKSGKSIITENLLLSIAGQREEFLGDKIYSPTPRVMLISLEEFYRNRTARNKNQIKRIAEKYGLAEGWEDNVIVIDDSFPRYLYTDAHWLFLEKEIERIKPSVVMIDSMTRLTIDPIEDSTVASKLMKRLREITYRQGIALIIIHHSQKMDNRPVTIASLAGSRVVGQEVDFMIGVNRTTQNIRYIKDVAYRYAPDDAEQVLKFEINEHQVVEALGYCTESEILLTGNGLQINDSDSTVLAFFMDFTKGDTSVVLKTGELYQKLVDTGVLSRPTLHAALNRLETAKALVKREKGQYSLAPIS